MVQTGRGVYRSICHWKKSIGLNLTLLWRRGFYTAELLKIIQAAFWIPNIFDTRVATPLSTNLNSNNNNNGPNGHLFYVGGDLMMRRGMLPIIMLPNGDFVLRCT